MHPKEHGCPTAGFWFASVLNGPQFGGGIRLTTTIAGAPHEPLHRCFEASGCIDALRRLVAFVRREEAGQSRQFVKHVPSWLLEPNFKHACARTTIRDAREYTRRFSRLRTFLQSGGDTSSAAVGGMDDEDCIERAVAVARVALGSALELAASVAAARICKPTATPSTNRDAVARLARLQMDGYFAAVWTDAHVNYTLDVTVDGTNLMYLRNDPHVDLGSPSMRRTVSISTLPNAASKFERFASCNQVDQGSKELIGTLFRCSQSGSRGWDASLKSSLANDGSQWVLHTLFKACLTGMHPQLHPSMRPDWTQRALILRLLDAHVPAPTLNDVLTSCSSAVKECVRIYMASVLDVSPATRTGLARTTNSLGALRSAPTSLAPAPLLFVAQTLSGAGLDVGEAFFEMAGRVGGLGNAKAAAATLEAKLLARFATEPRVRTAVQNGGTTASAAAPTPAPPPPPTASKRALVLHSSEPAIAIKSIPSSYNGSWFGRTTSDEIGADTLSGLQSTNSVNILAVVYELTTRAFRSQFIPFWLHGHGNGIRAARFDEAQFDHMLQTSALHQLMEAIDDNTKLRVQRLVMRTPTASTSTIAQVGVLLGLPPDDMKKLSAAKTFEEALAAVCSLSPASGAKVVFFGRVVHLKSKFLSFSLGAQTRTRQLHALKLRFEIESDDPDEIVRLLPAHAFNVFTCLECKRVPNACVDDKSKMTSHNEVGLAQTMLRVGGVGDVPVVRCARRSSAALRTAITKEEEALKHRIESMDVTEEKLRGSLRDSGDVAHAARLRRDIRTCSEQHSQALACGDRSLVQVSLLGRVVRLHNKFYALCSCCASVLVVNQLRRFKGDICCCRCDASMLRLEAPSGSQATRVAVQVDAASTRPPPPPFRALTSDNKLPCRYCNRCPPASSTASKFRVLRSPTDAGGRNAGLPPPLRTSAFCTSHFRPWLETALKELEIPICFAHIAEKASPILGADSGKRVLAITNKVHATTSTKTQKAILKRVRDNKPTKR